MNANVEKTGDGAKIPAGIFNGTELFAKNGMMYALHSGRCTEFGDLPGDQKRSFIELYLKDLDGQKFIQKQFGISGFESGFKQWLFCKFGALDGSPDSVSGKIVADAYNSACLRTDCPGRGRVCGVKSGLKGYEVETITALKQGQTAKEMADRLNVSVPAIKSRMERLKERFDVANIAALVASAAELGI